MKLICNATTPQELREEIVHLLLHRASLQRGLMTVTKTLAMRNMQEHAATVLGDLAGEIKCMELINQWPSGLRETPGKPIADMTEEEMNEASRRASR